jgi:signal recognition particle subunit SRP54
MFATLTERLSKAIKSMVGLGKLTDDNLKPTLKDIRTALLDADVALEVVKNLTHAIYKKSIGQSIPKGLSSAQFFTKLVHQELLVVMGEANSGLNLKTTPPAVILMAGLQGSGKTTATAKLAQWLTQEQRKSVLVVSTDIYRPAAMEQLQTLATAIQVACYPSLPTQKPEEIVKAALHQARAHSKDVVIIDTAGRLHVDTVMMAEIKTLHQLSQPIETLFVVDSMTGQDAANTARAFDESLPLTGIILTKVDGDARGGAALSIRHITGKPIKFLGVGEKTDALELFHPDRLASRILGMGDVLSLVEDLERKIDKDAAEKMVKKLKKGNEFDLEDFRMQMQQAVNLGGINKVLEKLPGLPHIPDAAKTKANTQFQRTMVIIDSMTKEERQFPDKLNGSRKRRIAAGSGTQIHDVNAVLKQYEQLRKMMGKMFSKGGLANMMRGLGGKFPSLPF